MFLSMTARAVVNVNNIYIAKPIHIFVKRGRTKSAHIMLSGCPKDLEEDPEAGLAEDQEAEPLPLFGVPLRSRARADRSGLRLPADPPPTSAACAARRRRGRTRKRRHATSTRYAAPSSAPADGSRRAAPVRR